MFMACVHPLPTVAKRTERAEMASLSNSLLIYLIKQRYSLIFREMAFYRKFFNAQTPEEEIENYFYVRQHTFCLI